MATIVTSFAVTPNVQSRDVHAAVMVGSSPTTVIVDRVRVAVVRNPPGYYNSPPVFNKLTKRSFIVFHERGGRQASFAGLMPPVDPMHLYRFECTRQQFGGLRSRSQEYHVERMISAERILLDRAFLCEMAKQFGGASETELQVACDKMTEAAKWGQCGSILREVGDQPWYKRIEERFPVYFRLWYIDELTKRAPPALPPIANAAAAGSPAERYGRNNGQLFNKVALSALTSADLYRLVRLPGTAPWKMCFWWLHELPIVDELSANSATILAQRFGAGDIVRNSHIREAAQAYSTVPFGHARDRGDSYVTMEEYKSAITNPDMRASFIKNQIVEIVKAPKGTMVDEEGRELRCVGCYAGVVGDRLCEEEVAKMITDIVSTNDDTEVVVRPQKLRWPWKGGDASTLTGEQARTLEMADSRRLVCIVGKPGVGKTSYVLRGIASMFARGTVVAVAFTGMAAKRLHDIVGVGFTAHHIIDRYTRCGSDATNPDYKFSKYKVLIIEEASNMSVKLLRHLLVALGGSTSLRRVIVTGDPRQMPPPGGGSSVLVALANRYMGTPLAIELVQSKRIADPSGSYQRNLDSIIEYNEMMKVNPPVLAVDSFERVKGCYPPLNLVWSCDPNSAASFVFVRRGVTPDDTVVVIRNALMRSGMHPDDPHSDYFIATHTNDQIADLAVPWYKASAIAGIVPIYRKHDFHINERVMFLENHYGGYPSGSALFSDPIMNGTTGCICDIYDEEVLPEEESTKIQKQAKRAKRTQGGDILPDLPKPTPKTTRVQDTADPPSYPMSIRWLRIAPPLDATISLNVYSKENIVRACPATVAKLQGQEADIVVVITDGSDLERRTYSRRELYTACSRGKQRCIIVGGIPQASSDNIADTAMPRICQDMDFYRIVANHTVYAQFTDFASKFPHFDVIDAATATSPVVSGTKHQSRLSSTGCDGDEDGDGDDVDDEEDGH